MKKHLAELTEAIEEKALVAVEMRWINDVSTSLNNERNKYNSMADIVMDGEDDEAKMEEDAKHMDEFQLAVQEALRQTAIIHSMKTLDQATQMLVENMTLLEQHYDLDSSKNYNASLQLCCQLQDTLIMTIDCSSLEKTHPQRVAAAEAMMGYLELTSKINRPYKESSDAKPKLSSDTGLGGMKYALHNAPTFSGEQKDYPSFWAEFQQIHTTPHFTDAAKLNYLRQAQLDPDIRRRMNDNVENGDKYSDVVLNSKSNLTDLDRCSRFMSTICCS